MIERVTKENLDQYEAFIKKHPLYFDGLIIQQQKGDLVCCQHNIQVAGDAIIQSTDST